MPDPISLITEEKPRLGLALSGAAARSVFYIGFLEIMQEAGITFDYIAACSSGSIVAASYACGTLPLLREQALSLSRDFMLSLMERSKRGGYYNLDRFEDALRVFTRNQNFEDVKPHMGFVAVDIDRGEQVVLNMGDLAHAARISCTLPGIFEPVQWGSRTLIDGGLLNILPIDVVKAAGMERVVGINMSGTKHIFNKNHLMFHRFVRGVRKFLLIHQAGRLVNRVQQLFERSDFLNYFPDLQEIEKNRPGMFAVMGRCLDLALEADKRDTGEELTKQCDIMIRPEYPRLRITNLSQSRMLYDMGRRIGADYVPHIKQLLETSKPRK